MANKLAALKMSLTYPAPGGGTVVPPAITMNAPFQASNVGFIDIPDGTAMSTEIPVPFDSIDTGASLLMILNSSGQTLSVKVNGAAMADLADGDTYVTGASAVMQVTSASIVTSADPSVGDKQVGFFVFGDPV